ncbi:MAG: hypothetical protein JWR26_4211 [Pedosphaera sp.]|nr:hypothetical protein [Pedosphaera sp.]
MRKNLRLGKNLFQSSSAPVQGQQVMIEGESFYRIANYDRMRPFFMSIVSSADHWMFISSNGALTAGRRNPDHALFPYYTDDKIHDSAEITGSKTVFMVQERGGNCLWEPFSDRHQGIYRIRRNLYKSFWGNKLIFEESNEDLGLTFRYGWFNSDRFGLVRKSWVINSGSVISSVRLLDGIQNLVPCGVGSQLQLEKSTLVDAYKKNELLPETGLGLFMLSSIIVDRPEPAESLKATTVWSVGLDDSLKLISSVQLNCFRQGKAVHQENDIRAERGAYFVQAEMTLHPGQTKDWLIVGDVDRGPAEVAELNHLLRKPARLRRLVEQDIERGTQELREIVAGADGLQKTAHSLGNARHFGNVLFNVMRGGVFHEGYKVDPADLEKFVHHANRDVATRHSGFFRKLAKGISHSSVVDLARKTGDADLERLCREYLPLTFSRRHGDPSRPWNRFSIPARNADGSRILNYEGNWRDIFQNWEALAGSFPNYVAGMICKFINASTADGYNPYRVSRDGIDWEVIDPADPWSHIGYWGDHQIIYLLKLLEILERHDPSTLRDFLGREIFSYANVPYRIKSYEHLLKNAKETVDFDQALEDTVRERVKLRGSDGKLRWDCKQQVQLVNLSEKLIVSVLAKLSNFIPEAGIWLNTQRPEWNDANNALVGNGVSMVTLYYLRRYLAFCLEIFGPLEGTEVALSEEVGCFLQAVCRILERHRHLMTRVVSNEDRLRVLDDLGRAGSQYREQIYKSGFSGGTMELKGKQLLEFFSAALDWIDHSIRANRREDGLYHAYNLITLDRKKGIRIRHLYEMLEGQVAALSSGSLSAEESLHVLTALRQGAMYRADQQSYLLYPDRQLSRFIVKNVIPQKAVGQSRLLRRLILDGNRLLVERDTAGVCHFNGALSNARDVGVALERLAGGGYGRLVKADASLVQEIFESLFDHQSFTGRSGTFFGYEGLGSIYWHMVSKLLLAAQETFFRAVDASAAGPTLKHLAKCYYDIRAGIGDHKSPEVYGAFPMDPYSHTPAHTGARQPGLTGQVKEDILCRMGELGIFVRGGRIFFRPLLLRREEFLTTAGPFRYFDVAGLEKRIALKKHSLAFTYCQVPVIYRLARERSLMVSFTDGTIIRSEELCLDSGVSRLIFDRAGKVDRIVVSLDLLESRASTR